MAQHIPLTRGYVAIVDDTDYADLAAFKWRVLLGSHTAYAVRSARDGGGPQHTIYMHRLITEAPSGTVVDHKDGSGLNNRRANLRVCTVNQNHWNTRKYRGASRFKGVRFHKPAGKWSVAICCFNERRHLGLFADEEEAALAYDRAAIELHGEFAHTNLLLRKEER